MTGLRLAIPSDGALYEGTTGFLRDCGLRVDRPNARRYTGTIPSVPGVELLFQRQSDITTEIDGESADLGIVGLDRFLESRLEGGDTRLIYRDIGFGNASLVVAVPNSWLDVTTVDDLADLALDFRERGRQLRIATKYPRLVGRFFSRRGINYFTIVQVNGALEAAPIMGYADLIADITASGATLRENQLRPLIDGVIVESQAAIIGNIRLLAMDDRKVDILRDVLERVEGSLRSHKYSRVAANIRGESAEDVALKVRSKPEVAGIEGPTISPVFSNDGSNWFEVEVIVPKAGLDTAVEHFRSLGGGAVTVGAADYVFRERCEAFEAVESLVADYRAGQPGAVL